ncbi:MAG: hypothetical protein EAZ95_16900 [Bacteroidetes bacterium]|nr:MAG: hypothetical protein EAZ95_16900 [Bacteroidota bacterium]
MNEKQLKEQLQKPFDWLAWKNILAFVFPKMTVFSSPVPIQDNTGKMLEGFQYASVELRDKNEIKRNVGVFVVKVSDNTLISRNRVQLREIGKKQINQDTIHASLVFYYAEGKSDYRLSLIAQWNDMDWDTGQLKKDETPKKRFTFLLGENQTATTPARRLMELKLKGLSFLFQDLIDAFSVETLNKEFFKQYKDFYEKMWRYLAVQPAYLKQLLQTGAFDFEAQNFDLQDLPTLRYDKISPDLYKPLKPLRDFTKKLLGRIVFLHFLQKKGWMGCSADLPAWENGDVFFLRNLFKQDSPLPNEQGLKFHSQTLDTLFFKTLNTKRPQDLFELTKNRVPYLNGGLFQKDQDDLRATGIDFPPEYFEKLFDFLESYNFTIDENDADEQEVGIDPEMLGHIFENLLEDNKDKGTFYTPKQIVQYMCKQSLLAYLQTNIAPSTQDVTTQNISSSLHAFVYQRAVTLELQDRETAQRIDSLLRSVRVCDPAVGSGAFAMGMVQEIYQALLHIYPHTKPKTPFSPVETKKEIIKNCIYGVDLEKGAIDIARLRFWLFLVVDAEKPEPLPNLDYKLMQGNSLIESFEGIDLSKMVAPTQVTLIEPTQGDIFRNKAIQTKTNFDALQNDIKKLTKQFFNQENPQEKERLRQAIETCLYEHIKANFDKQSAQIERFINEKQIEIDLLAKQLLTYQTTVKAEGKRKQLEKAKEKQDREVMQLQAEKTELTRKQARLLAYQDKPEKPYFLWHLYFQEVFVEKDGFDIFIGNPPYIQLQKMRDTEKEGFEDYDTYSKAGDIYCLFYERGFELLNKGGILAYITSNSWMRTQYGKLLRQYFREQTNPLSLLNFEDTQIFESATVESNIFIGQKADFAGKLKATAVLPDLYRKPLHEYEAERAQNLASLDDEGWIIADKLTYSIKKMIETDSIPLGKLDNKIYIGILNGYNDAFLIPKEVRDNLINKQRNSSDIIKPILRGRDVKKYSYEWANIWLINTHNGIKTKEINIDRIEAEKEYPFIYSHLKNYQKELEIRHNKGDHWTNLRSCGYFLEFDKPKIVWGELSDRAKFAYDDKKCI